MSVRIEYKGELIAAGTVVSAPLMFWTAIRLDPSFDASVVHDRLCEIRHQDRVYFEWRGVDWIAFPPAYRVIRDAPLATADRS